MCVIPVVAVAPCQCLTPGGIQMTSPGVDLLLLPTRLLDPAGSGRHDQGLAERMGMPCRAGTRLERDVSPRRMGRVIRLKKRIPAYRTSEVFGRAFTGGPGAVSRDGD